MSEILAQSNEACEICEPFTSRHMKNKLHEHFGDRVVITEINGKSNVVTFKSTAVNILNEFFHTPNNEDSETEKRRIIKTAAKLIKNDIKAVNAQDTYPSCEQLSSVETCLEYVPESLRILLRDLFVGKETDLKVASLGQAIMQATRPRVLTVPLQIGLGIQMHHHFASRFLVDTLNNLGYCSSYSEVKRFESSAAVTQ